MNKLVYFSFIILFTCAGLNRADGKDGDSDKVIGRIADFLLNNTDKLSSNYFEDMSNLTSDAENSSNSSVMRIENLNPRFVSYKQDMLKNDPPEEFNNPIWISYPIREGLRDFMVKSIDPECSRDIELYKRHFRNQTLWAIRMHESTQTEIVGLLGGTTYQMGSYEECVKTMAYGIKGKYCLANFRFDLKPELREKYQNDVPVDDYRDVNYESSVWDALVRLDKDPVRISRKNIFWGICLPASCSHVDLHTSLNDTLAPLFDHYGLQLDVNVDPVYCNTADRLPFTTGFYVMISFMSIMLLLNVISTLYDGIDYLKGKYERETSGWRELLAAFSVYRNTYNLGVYNKNSQVKLASAMKVLMMMLIIYGHSLMYLLSYPHFHPQHLEDVYRRGADIALVNTNIVDVFFTISGFITFYYGFHPMKVGGVVYLVLSIFFRYIRLMPVFAFVIAYVMYVMPYTSDGPVWRARIMPEVENCQQNWWLDMLLLNNFKNVDKACVLIGWYITDDMLLCMLASVLIYIIAKKPKFGLYLTIVIFLMSIATTYTVTYLNRFGGLLKLYMSFLEDPRKSVEFKALYIALYSRAGPYLVGFLGAYLTVKLQEMKFKFSRKMMIISCIIAIAIGEGSQYYGVVFYKYGRPYNVIENALYSSLHRVLFGVLFAWLLMLYLTTGYGIFDSVINHRVWTVFGRLTYSVFLMNTLSLMTFIASTRVPWFASYKFIMFVVFGDVVLTYLLGYLFYLYAEGPICGISKMLQKSLAKLFEKEIEKAKSKVEITEKNGKPAASNGDTKLVI